LGACRKYRSYVLCNSDKECSAVSGIRAYRLSVCGSTPYKNRTNAPARPSLSL
jgi:hypothetical protein